MRPCFVVGTRPEIIKMSPIIRECSRRGIDFLIIHTGQHYSYQLDGVFFKELYLPSPQYNLNVGSGTFSYQLSTMLSGLEEILVKEKPSYVLAEGDTNSVLAAALTASHLLIPFAHVESGLRSYNRQMQEEKNRIIADHVADIMLPPTEWSKDILVGEGCPEEKIFVTGNTIVDALTYYLPIAEEASSIGKFGVESRKYFLVTVHRAENVDYKEVLGRVFTGLETVHRKYGLPLIYPIHPRTRSKVEEFNLTIPDCVHLIDPVGFYDFLVLENNAALVLTDSGGVQEETCILNVPCVTLREDTERPETINVGSNLLAGTSPETIVDKADEMLSKATGWPNPFGHGNAAGKTIDILCDLSSQDKG